MLNTITHKIDLNMLQPNNFQYVHVMQHDYDAEYIKCTLYEGNEPYTVSCPKNSITVKCQLPNDREIEEAVESVDYNTITFKVTSKMTQIQGNVLVALSLFDTNGRISPFPFIMKVVTAPEGITDDDIMYGKLAEYYARLAESYAVGTNNEIREGDATDNSKYYCEKAAQHAKEAGETALNVKTSEISAGKYAGDASKSASDAAESAKQAGESASDAAETEKEIDNKASSALSSMTTKEENAKKYADLAQSYAIGTGNGVRTGDAADNSRHYWELVKNAIDNGQLAEFEYFETYAGFEEALKNNGLRGDILAVIKENVYNPSGTGSGTIQIDDVLSPDSGNAVQNKIITKAINDLEERISLLSTTLDNIKNNIRLGNWEFVTNGDTLEQNIMTGHSKINQIATDGDLTIDTGNNGELYLSSAGKATFTSDEIHIKGNGNNSNIYIGSSDTGSANVYLSGKVYINGKLIE